MLSFFQGNWELFVGAGGLASIAGGVIGYLIGRHEQTDKFVQQELNLDRDRFYASEEWQAHLDNENRRKIELEEKQKERIELEHEKRIEAIDRARPMVESYLEGVLEESRKHEEAVGLKREELRRELLKRYTSNFKEGLNWVSEYRLEEFPDKMYPIYSPPPLPDEMKSLIKIIIKK